MRVTAVVVNYNSAPDIHDCLDSLRASSHPVDIVVVDNASTDGSAEVLATQPDVTLVRSARNLGFAAGVNLGVEQAAMGEAVLLVNPDATLATDAVDVLVRALRTHPDAGAVGPLVANPDGSIQPSKRRFPSWTQAALHATVGVFWPGNPGTRAYVCADLPDDGDARVGWLSASVVLLRTAAFEQVGRFDPRFFFYVEDLDLCRRLGDAGWTLWFEPRARAVHRWGGSSHKPVRQLWQHHTNLLRYVAKHQRRHRAVVLPAVVVGLSVRFLLLLIRQKVLGHRLPAHHGHSGPDPDTAPGTAPEGGLTS